jgi:hypothetical protein
MSKPQLVRIGWTDLNSSYLEWILQDYFELENYNPTKFYSKDCVFVISRNEYWHSDLERYLSLGYRFIFANPWEALTFFNVDQFKPYLNNILVILGCKNSLHVKWPAIINVPRWFWYNESLWYTCENRMQYQNYIPNRTNTKLFFMPIKRAKSFRTQVIEKLDNILDQAVWSYVEKWCDGRHLSVRTNNPVATIGWDRQFEEEWYNDTYFTLAVETAVNSQLDPLVRTDDMSPCELFVTEKTFKPIAFQHPFMICGMPHTLKFLRENGFETFNHIFDESYDNVMFFEDRLDIIYNNIQNFDTNKYLDPLTKEKIKHNYNQFYNRSLVLTGIKNDLINPLLEWINAN